MGTSACGRDDQASPAPVGEAPAEQGRIDAAAVRADAVQPASKEAELPAPAWRREALEPPRPGPGADQFELEFTHVYLEGECAGEGRKRSDGIRVVARGRLTHRLTDLVYRGTLTGVLHADFADQAVFQRASGGDGFVHGVTSDAPWRPGEWRDFEVRTRRLDAIYCAYAPRVLTLGIHVAARTPLGQELDVTAATASPVWHTLGGVAVDARATLLTSARPKGPFGGGVREAGERVELRYVHRDRAWLAGLGWVSLSQLRVDGALSPARATAAATATVQAGTVRYHFETPRRSADGVEFAVSITNTGEKPAACAVKALVASHRDGDDAGAAEPALVSACRRLGPGESARGNVKFAVPTGAPLFEVGLRRGPSTPCWLDPA